MLQDNPAQGIGLNVQLLAVILSGNQEINSQAIQIIG